MFSSSVATASWDVHVQVLFSPSCPTKFSCRPPLHNVQRDCISLVLRRDQLGASPAREAFFQLGCRDKKFDRWSMVVTRGQPCTATLRLEIMLVPSAERCGQPGENQNDFTSPAIRMDNNLAAICPRHKQ